VPPGFVDAFEFFAEIAVHEAPVHVLIERSQGLGEFAAFLHIERHIEFEQDVLRALDIVMNGLVRFGGIFDIEPVFRSVQESDGSFHKHQYELAGRRGLHRDLAVRIPRFPHSFIPLNYRERLKRGVSLFSEWFPGGDKPGRQ
jgi:hypothetical protein